MKEKLVSQGNDFENRHVKISCFEHAETSYLRAGKTAHDSITFAGEIKPIVNLQTGCHCAAMYNLKA